MTKLLESAFEKISTLPDMDQNVYAKFIIDEMESELAWSSAFAKSEDLLEDMASEALEEFENIWSNTNV